MKVSTRTVRTGPTYGSSRACVTGISYKSANQNFVVSPLIGVRSISCQSVKRRNKTTVDVPPQNLEWACECGEHQYKSFFPEFFLYFRHISNNFEQQSICCLLHIKSRLYISIVTFKQKYTLTLFSGWLQWKYKTMSIFWRFVRPTNHLYRTRSPLPRLYASRSWLKN